MEQFEFLQHEEGNQNDLKVLGIYQNFYEAKKAGLGYFAEKDGILYIVPNPIIQLNDADQFHSEIKPAIAWKNGLEVYFLDGIHLEKSLWRSIMEKTLSAKDALAISNADQRNVAARYLGGKKILNELGGEMFAKDDYGELWRLKDLLDGNGNPYVFFTDGDPSKNGEPIYQRAAPTMETPQEWQTRAYKLNRWKMEYRPSVRT